MARPATRMSATIGPSSAWRSSRARRARASPRPLRTAASVRLMRKSPRGSSAAQQRRRATPDPPRYVHSQPSGVANRNAGSASIIPYQTYAPAAAGLRPWLAWCPASSTAEPTLEPIPSAKSRNAGIPMAKARNTGASAAGSAEARTGTRPSQSFQTRRGSVAIRMPTRPRTGPSAASTGSGFTARSVRPPPRTGQHACEHGGMRTFTAGVLALALVGCHDHFPMDGTWLRDGVSGDHFGIYILQITDDGTRVNGVACHSDGGYLIF